MADGIYRIIVRSNQVDLGSVTKIQIQIKELLFNDVYRFKVIIDMMSRFTRMEVLDVIYHQFFITANSLGRQLTTSQFFQLLTLLTLAYVAAAIHCALPQYSTGKKVTVMFSQDEYQGKFYPFTVIDCIIAEAIALIKFKFQIVGLLHTPPPPPNGAPLVWYVLLNSRRCSSLPFVLLSAHWCLNMSSSTPYCLFGPRSSSRIGAP